MSCAAQFLPTSNDEQAQRLKRGVFVRAGIVGAFGLAGTQSKNENIRNAGWAMCAASGATVVTFQVLIGDKWTERDRKRRSLFVKYLY